MLASQLIGLYTVGPGEFDDRTATAIDLDNAVAELKVHSPYFPAAPLYFGYKPVTAFDYHALSTQGVLALYYYPLGVAANKVLLAEMNLVDGLAIGAVTRCRVPVKPPLGLYRGNSKPPVGNAQPGDSFAVWIKTQAVGDSYLLGTFQPYLVMQYNEASLADQSNVTDLTPASDGIPNTTA